MPTLRQALWQTFSVLVWPCSVLFEKQRPTTCGSENNVKQVDTHLDLILLLLLCTLLSFSFSFAACLSPLHLVASIPRREMEWDGLIITWVWPEQKWHSEAVIQLWLLQFSGMSLFPRKHQGYCHHVANTGCKCPIPEKENDELEVSVIPNGCEYLSHFLASCLGFLFSCPYLSDRVLLQ